MASGIYILEFGNEDAGSSYIGKSVDIDRRWNEHFNSFQKGTSAKKMLDAYNKYGRPKASVILECHPDHIDLMESAYITLYEPDLNTSLPIKLSPEDVAHLVGNTPWLKDSTSTHIHRLNEYEELIDTLEGNTEQLEELVTLLERKRSEEEIEADIQKRIVEMTERTDKLNAIIDTLESNTRELHKTIDTLRMPWWRRLFSR